MESFLQYDCYQSRHQHPRSMSVMRDAAETSINQVNAMLWKSGLSARLHALRYVHARLARMRTIKTTREVKTATRRDAQTTGNLFTVSMPYHLQIKVFIHIVDSSSYLYFFS